MSESPIVSKSPIPYQIAIFLFVNIWAIMCYEVAQYRLVAFWTNAFEWIGWGTLVLWSMTPVLALCAWKLKDRVEIHDPYWEVKVREVNHEEFEEMVRSYNSGYRYLLVSFDNLLFVLILICYVTYIASPFYLMRTSVLLVSSTPLLIALIAIVFGLIFSYFIFKVLPNSATREFPNHKPKRFRKAISFMMGIPGIFWTGIKLSIGEAAGFYTLRDPIPIARIEGIEGAARIECQIDSSGTITSIVPVFELENFTPSKDFGAIGAPVTPVKTAQLVRSMLLEYISHGGGEEILEDVIEDIDTFLSKYEATEQPSK